MFGIFSDHSGKQLNVHALGLVVSLSGVLVVAPMLPEIIDYFGITSAEAGISISFMWACNALAQYPGGRYADRLSAGIVLFVSQSVMIAGFLLLATAMTFPVFVAGLGLIGVGYGMFETAGFVLLGTHFDERRGRAFGVRDAAVNLGSALSALLAVAVVGTMQWRNAFLPVLVLLGFITVGSHRLNRHTYTVSRIRLDLRAVGRRLFRSRQTYAVLLVMSVSMFLWQGSASFLPTYLRTAKSLTSFEATVGFSLIFVVGTVVTPLAGIVSEYWTPIKTGIAATGFGALGLSLLVVMESLLGLAAALFAYAVGLTAIWPVMYVYLADVLSDETLGSDLGALRTLYFAVGSIGPAYVGTMATRFGYSAAFTSLFVCFGLTTAALLWIARR